MADSAGQFGDDVTTQPYAAQRPRNDISGSGFRTGAADAAAQAAAGEARVLGVDQDRTQTGATNAATGQRTQRAGIAMPPADSPQFTRDPDA